MQCAWKRGFNNVLFFHRTSSLAKLTFITQYVLKRFLAKCEWLVCDLCLNKQLYNWSKLRQLPLHKITLYLRHVGITVLIVKIAAIVMVVGRCCRRLVVDRVYIVDWIEPNRRSRCRHQLWSFVLDPPIDALLVHVVDYSNAAKLQMKESKTYNGKAMVTHKKGKRCKTVESWKMKQFLFARAN